VDEGIADLSEKAFAALVSGSPNPIGWFIDSDSNLYIINRRKLFTKFHPLNEKVDTADRSAVLEITDGETVKLLLVTVKAQVGSRDHLG
jgi:hypothetical protein